MEPQGLWERAERLRSAADEAARWEIFVEVDVSRAGDTSRAGPTTGAWDRGNFFDHPLF